MQKRCKNSLTLTYSFTVQQTALMQIYIYINKNIDLQHCPGRKNKTNETVILYSSILLHSFITWYILYIQCILIYIKWRNNLEAEAHFNCIILLMLQEYSWKRELLFMNIPLWISGKFVHCFETHDQALTGIKSFRP